MSKNYFCEIVYNAYFDQHFTPVSPSKLQSKKTVPLQVGKETQRKRGAGSVQAGTRDRSLGPQLAGKLHPGPF